MKHYYMVMDADWFHQRLKPALSACWQSRSFQPCHGIMPELLAGATSFAHRYHTKFEDCLIYHLQNKPPPLDRITWRALVGEALLFTADELPEPPNIFDTLRHVLRARENDRASEPSLA